MGFSVTRSADLVGEGLGGFGFLVHRNDFPYGHAMSRQVRLAPRQGMAERDSVKFGFEALFDDVSCDDVALECPSGTRPFRHQPLVLRWHSAGYVGETLSRMRKLIKETDPDVVEEWKGNPSPSLELGFSYL